MSTPSLSKAQHWRAAFLVARQVDWRERQCDWRVWLVPGLGFGMALAVAPLTTLELRERTEARAMAAQAEQQRWLGQGRTNPHSVAHYDVFAFKPVSALAAVDPGGERYVGSSRWLEAHKQNEFVYRWANDTPGDVRQFSLTPALCCRCWPRCPATAAFASFGAWVAVAILLPALLAAAINAGVPVPSGELYVEAMRDHASLQHLTQNSC